MSKSAAFGQGDIESILAQLDENVTWDKHYDHQDVPWLQARRGHAGAMAFFMALNEHLVFERFEVEALLASEPFVVALVNLEARVKGNGQVIRERREAHIWEFGSNGKVVDFQHGADSLHQYRAWSAK